MTTRVLCGNFTLRWMRGASWPSTTISGSSAASANRRARYSRKVVPRHASSAFGDPMRDDSPAARITAAVRPARPAGADVRLCSLGAPRIRASLLIDSNLTPDVDSPENAAVVSGRHSLRARPGGAWPRRADLLGLQPHGGRANAHPVR